MSQAPTPPSADPDLPRPLPRRPAPRPQSARASRPRFAPLDAVWIAALAALSLAHSVFRGEFGGRHAAGSALAAGVVALLYLLGWRARDRAAGVGAALLAATSAAFLEAAAYSPQSAGLALLTLAALFAFVAGSSLAALAFAAAASLTRPDGLLLGLTLLALAVTQQRRRALYGLPIVLLPLLAVWIGGPALGYRLPALPVPAFSPAPLRWLVSPASLLLLWLLVPLCAEMSEPMRRARWLPLLLWTVPALAAAVFLPLTTPTGMTLPLMPLLFALAGGGLSRLLPTLAGESPRPMLRYTLATLAVLGLIGLHMRLEARATAVNTSAAPEPRSR